MKLIKLSYLILVVLIISIACNSGKKHEEDHEHHDHSTDTAQMDSESTRETEQDMNEKDITNSYLQLKDALVKSDHSLAKEAAKKLNSGFQQAELYSEAELITKIINEDDIEEQRSVFKLLSEEMYDLASENKVEFTTLYWQYCPMAFNNTGAYWLSNSKEILNPYFGDKMLKCGKVEETLAKK